MEAKINFYLRNFIHEKFECDAIIEEYIEGDEYDVCLLGNDDEVEVLPLIR